jgi:gluconolactonase
MKNEISRRELMTKAGAAAGTALFAARGARAQQAPRAPAKADPPTVISSPPRDFTPGATPVTYPDPDILTVDPAFASLRLGNTPIQRLWTGGLWCEGPACSHESWRPW